MASSTSSPPAPTNPLHLTIRFTTSHPDLLLSVSYPTRTSVITLKSLIRAQLPAPISTHRLRLIYSGKLLLDTQLLSSALKPPPPAPPADPGPKGKAPIPPPLRVYINCSIGDPLSPDELTAEKNAASAHSPRTSLSPINTSGALPNRRDASAADGNGHGDGNGNGNGNTQNATQPPPPRGFDQLLSSGFAPAEVNALRMQFLAIQAARHTPDTMPSPTTLRRMEDAWLDDNGTGGAGLGTGTEEESSGALDDLLWGHVMGFLWPLGAVGWAVREDGIWSLRRKMAVWSGVVVGVGVGIMRMMN